MGGVPDSPVTSRSPSWRSGWTTEAFQPTRAAPSSARRTTVIFDVYASGFVLPL